MLALYVDYNSRERLPGGSQAVFIKVGSMNPAVLAEKMTPGLRVILYDEDTCCQGVLRRDKSRGGWSAEIIPETIKDLSADEFKRLRSATKRAAIGIAK